MTQPPQLCQDATLRPSSFCMPASRLERALHDGPLKILSTENTREGVTGALTVVLDLPDQGLTIRAKWKEARPGGRAINNDPRKELAAYELQKLIFEEEDYVVPPTVSRCVPLDYYEVAVRPSRPTFAGTSCVFGVFSYWVEGIEHLDGFDRNRFDTDPRYRGAIANLNIFAYLINHRDTRVSNFAISKDPDHVRALAIDNGMAFSGFQNPKTLFLGEWKKIMVPRLPHTAIDRLRHVTRTQLDALAVVAQYEVKGGQLDRARRMPPTDPNEGVRRSESVLQLGLAKGEIDAVEERIKDLVARVDRGDIEVY